MFCCSFVCLAVQRAIKTPHAGRVAGKRSPGEGAGPRPQHEAEQPLGCADLYLSALRCARLHTDRCVGELQSKDSARKEMKGRGETGPVQPSEASAPPRRWLSPARSRGQPGLAESGAGALRHRWHCGAGAARPSRQQGQGRSRAGTRHIPGSGVGPAGSSGMHGACGEGVESDGAERGGHSCPAIPGAWWHCRDGTQTGTWQRDAAKVSPLPGSAARGRQDLHHLPLGSVPCGAGHCPLLAATGEEKLRPGDRGHCPGSFPA